MDFDGAPLDPSHLAKHPGQVARLFFQLENQASIEVHQKKIGGHEIRLEESSRLSRTKG